MHGPKHRGNWSIGVCLRGDCIYHGNKKECDKCIVFRKYKKKEDK